MSRDRLAEVIWEASRADEGTISATGANIVAAAVRAYLASESQVGGLPEVGVMREWCVDCDSPQDVDDVSEEIDVQTIHGTGPEYTVYHLVCGHSIAVPSGGWG